MKRQSKNYPVYVLRYETQRGAGRYHTKRKNSFLYRLAGLQNLQTLKKCHWLIEYNHTDRNESISYTDPVEALRVARIFTAADEVRSFL